MAFSTPPLSALTENAAKEQVVFLFSADPVKTTFSNARSPPPRLGFHLRPKNEDEISQNFAVWRAVQASSVHSSDISILSADPCIPDKPLHVPVLMLRVPRSLYLWLAKLTWSEVVHAILCELHRAALDGLPLRVLARSIREELHSMTKRERYWVEEGLDEESDGENGYTSGSETPGDPYDTSESRELAKLEERLCVDGSGSLPILKSWSSVPTAESLNRSGQEREQKLMDAVLHTGWSLWVIFVNIAMRIPDVKLSYYADRFSNLIADRNFEFLWAQVKTLYEMGRVRKQCRCPNGVNGSGHAIAANGTQEQFVREGKGLEDLLGKEMIVRKGVEYFRPIPHQSYGIQKKRQKPSVNVSKRHQRNLTYFACLPEEILTEYIIPMVFLDASQMHRDLQSDI